MSERFLIRGQKPLKGVVDIGGYKNSAGALLAATLLTDKECIIDNLPLVQDVFKMIEILKSIGADIEWISERKIKVRASSLDPEKMDFEKVGELRMSVLLIGGLAGRFKNFKISHPGGDKIGLRPIFTHIKALNKLGIEIKEEGNFYYFNINQLKGVEIFLKEFSVTATENLMMAGCMAKGETIIKGAACEPQVQDLGKMLRKMGADIKGVGTHTIKIKGVDCLKGAKHRVISDPLEAGTFIAVGAVVPGEIEVRNVIPEHLDFFLDKLQELGVNFKVGKNFVKVKFSPKLRAVKIQALPYPGFPTDLLPIIVPVLTQAKGRSLIHDPLYENRFNYTLELRKMGADIEIVDPHRAFVFGKTSLKGLRINSWDIRAGATLVIAGLMSKGETILEDIYQIDRGYEKIEEKLQKLGADIQRVKG